jgi:hypothetical protein
MVLYWGKGVNPFQVYSPPLEMKPQIQTFELALQKTKLDELQKIIFQERFIQVLRSFERRCFYLAYFFHLLRVLVSVGSLIVPALLSIQYSDTSASTSIKDPESFAYEIYWATWVISLLVTTSNGIVSVFKIDKKYYYLHTAMEQLRSEGWQYLQLSGRYSGFYTPGKICTHENQFVYFCHAVEKIKMHQVEEEYFKLTDAQTPKTTSATSGSESKENPLIHPTPQASLEEIAKNLPPELKKQLKSFATLDGATAPALPVSTELQTTSSGEKSILRVPSDKEMSEKFTS